MSLDTYAWLPGSKYRLLFLKKLANNPMLPSELATEFNINRSSVSRTLSELKKQNLVSRSKGSSRTIVYFVTDKGEEILEYMKKISAQPVGGK